MRVGINGAGIAGPTLAYWLAQYGHEAVIYERAPALRTGGYLIDFWGLGYDIAERMGLMPVLREHCYLMERLSAVDARGRELAGMPVGPVREALRDRYISLSRAELAKQLFDACRGVASEFGVSIASLEEEGERVRATLSDGRSEVFDLVVGADGLHSRVRELTFGPEARFEVSLGCYVAAFRLRGYPHRDELAYVSHTVPGRQVARVSLRDDETLVLLVARSDRFPGEPLPELRKDALRRVFSDMRWEVPEILDRMQSVDQIYFDRVSQIHLEHWTQGRVALLGDAAACVSLLAGEGTGLAMTEAYVLAGELHRASGDLPRAFAAYERKLRDFVRGKQQSALRLRGFFAPKSRLALTTRNLALRAMSVPFVTRHVFAAAFRDSLELPDYPGPLRSPPRDKVYAGAREGP